MKKLFKVEIQRIIAVYADDESEARQLAIKGEKSDVDISYPDFVFCDEVSEIEELPFSWHRSVPINNCALQAPVSELLTK